ncbi:class I SAM-dependent methyltransferase [Desulfococcaceae bacterium HSG7]|nr:class I SAM-dependent methyltransferase [Desulfococcaceae bacterium HSG7]
MENENNLTAAYEPFDSFWEAPANIEKGYSSFNKFYRRNYLKYMPLKPSDNILVISCGPGYFVELLKQKGIESVLGIDSDPEKIAYAGSRRLNCKVARAFDFLAKKEPVYDVIFAEQELNHLTKTEIRQFIALCCKNLKPGGMLAVHSLNGANPITGAEALAQNFDHYNTLTEYSLRQVLENDGFNKITIFPLNLYIFYENPLNYIGWFLSGVIQVLLRTAFIFYGKNNRIFTKKIGAVCRKKQ